MSVPRVGVICDFVEENWPSMDLVGDMLVANLLHSHASYFEAVQVRPAMTRRFSRFPVIGRIRSIYNSDRLINRFWDYPRFLRRIKWKLDLFHVIDHSYAQLIHHLPPDRTVVTCHDLDTFRCLLTPAQNRRSRSFRAAARRILIGLCKAARVTCDSIATRQELVDHGLIPPERVSVVRNGVHPSCSAAPDPLADMKAADLLGQPSNESTDILHVGSTVPRKRVDILLKIFRSVLNEFPQARLIRAGGPFTDDQVRLVEELKLAKSTITLPFLDRELLAAVYRRAALVMQTSDREGFGLPVIEAMACGTPVVASDLPVLREVGGEAATYCPAGDVSAWSKPVIDLLYERKEQPDSWSRRRSAAMAQASKFSWREYTQKMVALYRELL